MRTRHHDPGITTRKFTSSYQKMSKRKSVENQKDGKRGKIRWKERKNNEFPYSQRTKRNRYITTSRPNSCSIAQCNCCRFVRDTFIPRWFPSMKHNILEKRRQIFTSSHFIPCCLRVNTPPRNGGHVGSRAYQSLRIQFWFSRLTKEFLKIYQVKFKKENKNFDLSACNFLQITHFSYRKCLKLHLRRPIFQKFSDGGGGYPGPSSASRPPGTCNTPAGYFQILAHYFKICGEDCFCSLIPGLSVPLSSESEVVKGKSQTEASPY